MIEGGDSSSEAAASPAPRRDLAGARVLVAEDSFYIAFAIETALQAEGARVIGPVANLGAARALADSQALDLAVVDLNLEGELSLPLVRALRDREIGVIAATGRDIDPVLREDLAGVPLIMKPYTTEQILDALRTARRN